jgi:hypothetical protein
MFHMVRIENVRPTVNDMQSQSSARKKLDGQNVSSISGFRRPQLRPPVLIFEEPTLAKVAIRTPPSAVNRINGNHWIMKTPI